MKAGVYRVEGRSHFDHLTAMSQGLHEHGIAFEYFSSIPSQNVDFCVVWSFRVALRVKQYFSGPILVMERGYLGNRFEWTSLGWDGLNGRARFTRKDDSCRFEKHFGHLLKPWRETSGYALIVGQVVGDSALIGTDIHKWYRDVGVALWKQGWDVKFRQHPVEAERGIKTPHVPFAETLNGYLDDALSGAGLVVSFNSNSGVDAILAGVPVHAQDSGSMVFDLASHDLQVTKPDREKRLHEMAWMQFQIEEIKSGAAWEIARESMQA
ncbi:hypothetical protein [Rhizobium azibense]|uniref:Uncharacterized protein n=1 Tax=Rhizobium azibense TaxID=1136135 RepID=A0A4R3RID5_9HYPH|nr:hypothetical protein [Rhizobium azibense]TCU34149.1 hypothetical protein EV129_113134 [Rhizobium azibense]